MRRTIWHPKELEARYRRVRTEKDEQEMARRRCAVRRQLHRLGRSHEELRPLDLGSLRRLREEVLGGR